MMSIATSGVGLRRPLRTPLLVAAAVSISGCSSIFGEDCAALRAPAIVVRVTNAPSGAIPTSGVTLVVRGPSNDSVTTMSFGGSMQAGDRPGTYSVIVRQSGYREFSRSGVRVPGASCNQPETVRLDVTLQPL